jgi:hypothetical protein
MVERIASLLYAYEKQLLQNSQERCTHFMFHINHRALSVTYSAQLQLSPALHE